MDNDEEDGDDDGDCIWLYLIVSYSIYKVITTNTSLLREIKIY